MRTLTRKLLSLLLAFTMVCAMVPAAMASGEENPGKGTETTEPETTPTEEPETPPETEEPVEHKHVWDDGEVTQEPTCGKDGIKTFRCTVSDCAETYEEKIPATGEHKWGEGVVTTEASCEKAGLKTYTCSVCGQTKTEDIPALGHTPLADSYKSTGGSEHSYYCTTCQKTITEAHKWSN